MKGSTLEYKGPRKADAIAKYLKKQVGPASAEIKSSDDSDNIISENKFIIVGVFTKFSGEEFENFTAVANKLRSDYDFGHVLDAKLLPHGDSTVKGPIVRLFKPYDEQNVDFEDFHVEALENFIEVATIPVVTIYNGDPENGPLIAKFFTSDNAKAIFYLNFSCEHFDAFKSNYREVASKYKGKGISFLMVDANDSQASFLVFGIKEDQAPVIFLEENDGKKYLDLFSILC